MKAIIDTNAMMVPGQFRVDIFSELRRLGYVQWILPSSVLSELRHLAAESSKGKDKIAARVALEMAGQCDTVCEDDYADMAIERLAIKEKAAVFTNDKALKKRLFSKGITVIYLRQGRYLEAMKRNSDV